MRYTEDQIKKNVATCEACRSYVPGEGRGRGCKYLCHMSRRIMTQAIQESGKCPQGKFPLPDTNVRKVVSNPEQKTRMAWTHANYPGNRWEFTPPREGYHGPFSRRNLLFHLCPLEKDQLWRRHAAQLWKYRPIFTGRRIVAIATGKGVLPADQVREALGEGFETVEVPNDPQLREVASFPTLLKEIASLDPTEVTFYAHSKGNSTADDPVGALRWTAMMYSQLLGRWLAATALLEHFASVGTMKIVWPEGIHGPYPTQQPSMASLYPRLPGRWMFAGTFFWFRHSDVFSKPNWSEVLPDRYAAEAWLSGLFEAEEGFSMFQPWPEDYYPTPSPYDPRHYPEYLDWKDGRISSYTI